MLIMFYKRKIKQNSIVIKFDRISLSDETEPPSNCVHLNVKANDTYVPHHVNACDTLWMCAAFIHVRHLAREIALLPDYTRLNG